MEFISYHGNKTTVSSSYILCNEFREIGSTPLDPRYLKKYSHVDTEEYLHHCPQTGSIIGRTHTNKYK
jgi:hypothetical protein